MAATVDPFSFATAELSEEYVGFFPHPDIVFRYLENVSDKTGAQLLLGFNNTVSIKGSWMSLGRVRSSLTELLASYSGTDYSSSRLDKTDEAFQTSHHVQQSIPNEHTVCAQTSALPQRIQVSTSVPFKEFSDSFHPQEHAAKTNPAAQKVSQDQVFKPPEPLVMYSDLQLNPDPAAKNIPTLDNIERALKNMYTKNKFATSAVAKLIQAKKTSFTENEPNKVSPIDVPSHFGSLESDHVDSIIQYVPVGIAEKTTTTSKHNPVIKQKEYSKEMLENVKSEVEDSGTKGEEMPVPVYSKVELSLKKVDIDNAVKIDKNITASKNKLYKEELNTGNFNVENKKACLSKTSSKSGSALNRADEQLTAPIMGKSENADDKSDVTQNNSIKIKKKVLIEKDNVNKVKLRKRKKRTVKKKENPNIAKVEISNFPQKKKRGRPPKPLTLSLEEKHFLCDLCSYVTKNHSDLHRHKLKSHPRNEYKCEECGRMFGCSKNLKRHLVSHRGAENACDTCGKMYKSRRSLAAHLKTHAEGYVKPEFPCEFCSKVFSTKYVLAQHIKADHLGMKPTFFCPVCGKSFTQKHSYLEHANIHLGVKPYQCEICGKSFSYDQALKEHKYMHDETKRFECLICHKKFRQRRALSIHVKIHSDHKDYVCSTCGKGFSQKQAMIRHERVHTGQTPFLCATCGRSFADSSVLRRHMIFVHKKNSKLPPKNQEAISNNAPFSVTHIHEIKECLPQQFPSPVIQERSTEHTLTHL